MSDPLGFSVWPTRNPPMNYLLIGQTPVPEPDLLTWACAMEDQRRVALTRVLDLVEVSTVFLGLDHNWGSGPPLLFETMAFWLGDAYEQKRCSTWQQAEAQHAAMVREIWQPARVLAWIARAWRNAVDEARDDLRERWSEL